jgi:hypothetical protein
MWEVLKVAEQGLKTSLVIPGQKIFFFAMPTFSVLLLKYEKLYIGGNWVGGRREILQKTNLRGSKAKFLTNAS